MGELVRKEGRIWGSLFRWLTGRAKPDGFGYGRSIRPMFVVVLVLVLVEGAVVEGVLALVLGNSVWVWIGLALHLYAVGWIAGVIASVARYPHVLDGAVLRLRDSVFADLGVPLDGIAGVRAVKRTNLGRSGLKVDPATGAALLAYGDATVRLDLHPGVRVDGAPTADEITSIAVTVDEPEAFVAALSGRR